MKIKIYIVTYNNDNVLRRNLEKLYSSDLLLYDYSVNIINNYSELIVSFIGFPDKIVKLPKLVNYDFKVILTEGNTLKEVKIFAGKTSKKNNPALDILRKIWERRRKNGLKMFKQYQYKKYEKVNFLLYSVILLLMMIIID